MKFGICTRIEHASVVHAAGFDFMECTVVSLQPEQSDTAVRDIMSRFLDSPLPVEAFNVLLPRDLLIVGESVDYSRIRRYLSKALERVKAVGGETIVFGSGRSRMLPEGFPRAKGEEQLVRFLDMIADEADPLHLTVVVEPLNTSESNIINSVPEAVHWAKQVNRKSIRVLADFYHMHKENEPLEHIAQYGDYIRHIHVSDSRYAPGMGNYPYETLVRCIRQANYDGRISIECLWNRFEKEAAAAKTYLDRAFGIGADSA